MNNFDIVKMAEELLKSNLPTSEDMVKLKFENALKNCDEAIKNIIRMKILLVEGYEEWKKKEAK